MATLKDQVDQILEEVKSGEDYFDIYEAIRQDIRERGDDCATEDKVNRQADNELSDFITFIAMKFAK